MKKTWYVIKREYLENVRKKSFLISTFLVPVLMLAFTFVPMLATYFVPDEQVKLVVLDRTGEVSREFTPMLSDTLDDGRPKYLVKEVDPSLGNFDDMKDRLIAKVKNDELDVVIDIPADIDSTGKFYYYTKDVGSVQILESMESRLNSVILKRRLAMAGMDYDKVKNLTKKVSLDMRRVSKRGEISQKNVVSDWAMVFIFVMILYMTLLTWGMSIQRSLIEEKGSRVIEVLLSSLEPKDLFFGKILGLGAVGLTQITIWVAASLSIGIYIYVAASQFMDYISFSPLVLVYFLVFYILGFLFYSSLFTIVGATCSTEQEAQQLQSILTLPLVLPLLVLMLIIQSPNSTVSVILSLIPVFSPMLMMARIVILTPDFWQIALSIILLAVSIYGGAYFSSRVFRVGILMYGKRPGIKEIIKWFRYA
jgi:ABC-2 type transport system permease protein